MKTTGVLPDSLAASISRLSRPEMDATPDSPVEALGPSTCAESSLVLDVFGTVVLISSSRRLGGRGVGAASTESACQASLPPARARIRQHASAVRWSRRDSSSGHALERRLGSQPAPRLIREHSGRRHPVVTHLGQEDSMFTRRSGRWRAALVAVPVALVVLFSLGAGRPPGASAQAGTGPQPTIVLVHGDWADASTWASVIERLQRKGLTAVAPPNLLRGPATDAPYLASYLKSIVGPIVLVAHSYGGFVATNAATGNDDVKALVYIDAFAPDEGETAGELVARGGSCVGSAFNVVPYDGGVDLYLPWEARPSYPGFME